MADVTVSDLAKSVNTSVERLLGQMKDAGLSHSSPESLVSDEEKKVLLTFLKASHGDQHEEAPKKITIKRKTTSTLKTGSGSGRKIVNVEVRSPRTYVKRDLGFDKKEAKSASVKPVKEVADHSNKTVVDEMNVKQSRSQVEFITKREESAQQSTKKVKQKNQVTPDEKIKVDERGSTQDSTESTPQIQKKVAFSKPSFIDDIEEKRLQAIEARRQLEEQECLKKEERAKKEKEEEFRKQQKKEVELNVQKNAEKSKKAKVDDSTRKKSETVKIQDEDRGKHKKKDKHQQETNEEQPRKTKPIRKGSKKGSGHKIDISRLNDDYEEEEIVRKTLRPKLNNKHGFKKPTEKVVHTVDVMEGVTVSELAGKMNVKANVLVKELIKMGVMATINQSLDQEAAQLVVEELGHKPNIVSNNALEESLQEELITQGDQVSRAPVVTVMGHVDHGKTSLLDYIRNTKVTAAEAGGITQHIGAYRVATGLGEVAFLDTPGHAAFTAMRARGAKCTDVVVLVVAADDGVMPQTEEAIQHARAADVPIVVAVNKCDKETADPDRVKNELSAKDVIPEDWGGDVQFVNVSAHTGEGIDKLLESISLQAELLELSAVVDAPAKGVVVESRIEKGRGVVATVLVQSGTLDQGDILLAGQSYGRVRAMTNEMGQRVSKAGPSTPVELLGLASAPNAGDEFVVVPDERRARDVAEHREERERQDRLKRQQALNLQNMFANMEEGKQKVLSVVVKADVRGSLEAINAALADMGNGEAQVSVISSGVGGITGNDVNLALTSEAIIIGFNVRADATARRIAESESVEIRYYSIIYQLLDEVKSALEGMLEPERIEEIVGIAEVRDTFRSPKFGQVAGCMVTEGTVYRNEPIRVLRDNVVIYEGELESLRRFKDDVSDVRSGVECGIGVKNYDVKVGDLIEVYKVTEVKREL